MGLAVDVGHDMSFPKQIFSLQCDLLLLFVVFALLISPRPGKATQENECFYIGRAHAVTFGTNPHALHIHLLFCKGEDSVGKCFTLCNLDLIRWNDY